MVKLINSFKTLNFLKLLNNGNTLSGNCHTVRFYSSKKEDSNNISLSKPIKQTHANNESSTNDDFQQLLKDIKNDPRNEKIVFPKVDNSTTTAQSVNPSNPVVNSSTSFPGIWSTDISNIPSNSVDNSQAISNDLNVHQRLVSIPIMDIVFFLYLRRIKNATISSKNSSFLLLNCFNETDVDAYLRTYSSFFIHILDNMTDEVAQLREQKRLSKLDPETGLPLPTRDAQGNKLPPQEPKIVIKTYDSFPEFIKEFQERMKAVIPDKILRIFVDIPLVKLLSFYYYNFRSPMTLPMSQKDFINMFKVLPLKDIVFLSNKY